MIGLGKNRRQCWASSWNLLVAIDLSFFSFPFFLHLSQLFTSPRHSQQPPNTESRFAVYDERFGAIPHQKASIGTKCSRSRARHRTPRRRFSPPTPPSSLLPPPPPPGIYISLFFLRYSTNFN